MSFYEQVLNNKSYIDTIKKIEKIKFITNGKWDWEHGLGHSKRVANYVKKILQLLKADERTIELGITAALLHDVGLSECAGVKTDHALNGSKMFRKFISSTDITVDEERIIEQAIADHSNGDNIESVIGLALVLADKLDVTYHRTENSSIQDEMNLEIQKIRNVDIDINEDSLVVNYTTRDSFDINILMEWEKAIAIPKKIAKILKKEFVLMVNNNIIDCFFLQKQ